MTLTNRYPDRGSLGPTPALTTREDESFLDYIKEVSSVLMMARAKEVHPAADKVIEDSDIKIEPTAESVEAVRSIIREKLPEAGVWARVYRTTQDTIWKRVSDSYGLREDEFLRLLDESDKKGPGSVTWDPEYTYPEYAKVEMHLQPAGFTGHPLAGLCYDYGNRLFSAKFGKNDGVHKAMAEKISLPKDGRVARVMDLACSVGKLTCQLKRRFPEAEVWGSDISAPMVRYAHHRAIQENLDVHFIQKAAEDLDELPEGELDLVTVHILFHEVPTPVVDRAIKNVFRLLRSGGTFWISDFPTLSEKYKGLKYTNLLGSIDSADNSEPYAPEFVRSNIEDKLERIGFRLRYTDPDDIYVYGRVCDKPI